VEAHHLIAAGLRQAAYNFCYKYRRAGQVGGRAYHAVAYIDDTDTSLHACLSSFLSAGTPGCACFTVSVAQCLYNGGPPLGGRVHE
jgi:hypothetical protein